MTGVTVKSSELLRTCRLALRPAQAGDLQALVRAAHDADTSRIEQFLLASLAWWEPHGYGLWLSTRGEDAAVLGWCGLRPDGHPRRPELMYGVAPEHRGAGFATEAAQAVVGYAFAGPKVATVWAATMPTHLGSIRVMEKLGMSFKELTRLDGVSSVVYEIQNPG